MDLTTTYLGIHFKSPLVVGAAAPLTEDIDNLKRIEDAGGAGVVLHSLFEEQIRQEKLELHHHLTYGTHSFAEALTYFPEPEIFHVDIDHYLEHIRTAKESLGIPIIGSLNGTDLEEGWTKTAKEIEQAGADAIELNIYYVPTDMTLSGLNIEQNYLNILKSVKSQVNIPVAIKISPYFTNMANMAHNLVENGADGLVLFNRFYQPDIDIDELEVTSNVLLSSTSDMRLPMRWIAILYGRLNVDFAATSGIQRGHDVLKMMMAGANVTLLVSTLLRHGIHYIGDIEAEMRHWMEEHEYESIKQMQGSMSQINCPNESAFERAQYMKAIQSYHPEHSLT
jgi:dihydroorotate dehydrogenase (fumarate)